MSIFKKIALISGMVFGMIGILFLAFYIRYEYLPEYASSVWYGTPLVGCMIVGNMAYFIGMVVGIVWITEQENTDG